MKAADKFQQGVIGVLTGAQRKKAAFTTNIFVLSKIWNLLKVAVKYIFRLEWIDVYPIVVKIDDSPLCQLKCPVCIHSSTVNLGVGKQNFVNKKMDLDLFRKIVDEVAGKSLVISFGHMGEPLLNTDTYKMIRYASDNGMNSYLTTNFSMNISDENMHALVTSGLTILTVALDGFTQEVFEISRVNGNLSMVKDNLERLIDLRNKLGIKTLTIEAQTVEFEHNAHEIQEIVDYCKMLGVDKHYLGPGEEVNWVTANQPANNPKKLNWCRIVPGHFSPF
jgi:MoaA/NifB/PqqE/SkfB family radical SAM enzyme